jgi:hypothetical protein
MGRDERSTNFEEEGLSNKMNQMVIQNFQQ